MVWPFTSRRGGDPAFGRRAGSKLAALARERKTVREEAVEEDVEMARPKPRGAAKRAARYDAAAGRLPESFPKKMLRWMWRGTLAAGALALVAGLVMGSIYVRRFMYKSPYFHVTEVKISGAGPELEQEARAWLVTKVVAAGNNLVRVDRPLLRAGLAKLPRAKEVRVHKVYPDTLQVAFTERQPFVLANVGDTFLMDREGVLLARVRAKEVAAVNLPLVTGITETSARPGTKIESARLSEVLDAVQFINTSDGMLKEQIREWNIADRAQVTALLKSGTEVKFGEEPLLALLPNLSAGLEQRSMLRTAASIDLRMERQLVVQPGKGT